MSELQPNDTINVVDDLLEKMKGENQPLEEQLEKTLENDAELIVFRQDTWLDW